MQASINPTAAAKQILVGSQVGWGDEVKRLILEPKLCTHAILQCLPDGGFILMDCLKANYVVGVVKICDLVQILKSGDSSYLAQS